MIAGLRWRHNYYWSWRTCLRRRQALEEYCGMSKQCGHFKTQLDCEMLGRLTFNNVLTILMLVAGRMICCRCREQGWHCVILRKIHVHGRGDDSVVPSVRPVTPVVWGPPLDIFDHASKQANLPPFGCSLCGPSGPPWGFSGHSLFFLVWATRYVWLQGRSSARLPRLLLQAVVGGRAVENTWPLRADICRCNLYLRSYCGRC